MLHSIDDNPQEERVQVWAKTIWHCGMASMSDGDRFADERPVKISVRNVFKVFGDQPKRALELLKAGKSKSEIHAETRCTIGVNNANFDIYAGEIFVIMGLSGSGKSTMLRLLNRLIDPTSGAIEIDGANVVTMSQADLIALRRREISMVFQSFALLPNRTVLDNAAFGLEVSGMDQAARHERARVALKAVGLDGYDDSRPDQLSGGMKQRVGLARALAAEPTVLLMDEAFSALDPLIRTEMQDELVRLQAEHSRTIVFVSHDLDEAMRIGDRICIMQNGEVVQVGTPDEIVLNPANDYVRSFFRNVDVSQVFSASDVARKTQITIIERRGVSVAAALGRMETNDRDLAIVVGRDKTYRGMVSRASLLAATHDENNPYEDAYLPGVEPINGAESLSSVIGKVAASAYPVPVIDNNNLYLGSISKTALLETLDRSG